MAFRLPYLSSVKSGRPRAGAAWGDWLVFGLAALCIGLAVNLFWILVAPVGSVGSWKAKPPMVLSASERQALFTAFDPFSRTAAQSGSATNVTSLSLALFGTRFNEYTGGGSAIIAGADGIQQSYAVGEEVMPGVLLSQVAFDHVVLSRNGVLESLYLDQSVPAETVGQPAAAPPPANPAPGPATAASGEVKLNAASLRDSISATPRNENGSISGIVLNPIGDGTLLKAAGLAPGDVLVSINGRPVGAASDIAAQIRPGAKLTLEVERGSQKIPVGLNLE